MNTVDILGYVVVEDSGLEMAFYGKDERDKAIEEAKRLTKTYGPFYTVAYLESVNREEISF